MTVTTKPRAKRKPKPKAPIERCPKCTTALTDRYHDCGIQLALFPAPKRRSKK